MSIVLLIRYELMVNLALVYCSLFPEQLETESFSVTVKARGFLDQIRLFCL